VHRTESAHCSVQPSSISKPAQGHAGVNWPSPPDRWLLRARLGAVPIVSFRSHCSYRARTPTASATSRPCQLPLRRVPPASRPPRAVHAAAIPCAAPLAGARMLTSRARDSCVAAGATSRRRYRLAAMSFPHATHPVTAPCLAPSHCRSVGEVISPLPVTATERRPLCSAHTVCLCSLIVVLLCSKRRSANHPAPLSCASEPREQAAEPQSTARNR
jgi:hypothetical protein